MRKILILLLLIPSAFAGSITNSKYYDYKVFFTNPECKGYEYKSTVYSFAGDVLDRKPENVYCKYKDASKNQLKKTSPHYNIKKLISSTDVDELKMAYLSFSSSDILKTLCDVTIKKNNTKLTLIVDQGNLSDEGKKAKLDKLAACKPAKKYVKAGNANYPRIEFRGKVGGIGYAHNKIIMANYKSKKEKTTIVFSSANMSSGTVLHHENWHFLTTSTKSYFSQVHECIIEGMDNNSKTKRTFVSFMKSCRKKISTKEESDIKVFAVPGDGKAAMDNIVKNIKKAKRVSIAVHRFSQRDLISSLQKAAKSKKQNVRFIADDDIYFAGKYNELPNAKVECSKRKNPNLIDRVGANMCNEYFNVKKIEKSGAAVKYMQTNHSLFLLHHNKYIVFENENGTGAVHCGAGNFTGAAFSKNFENFYFITVPEVVESFKKQYQYAWDELATSEKDLPNITMEELP